MPHSLLGKPAPDFSAEAHTGQQVSLADFRGKQVVILYFYPADGTPVCTKEACAFRDAYEEFVKAGAAVIGVSADTLQRHRAFATRQGLPFLLLSDRDGTIRKAYGVSKTLGLLPGRVTFVIDRESIVRHVFRSMFSADRRVTEALEVVRRLAQSRLGVSSCGLKRAAGRCSDAPPGLDRDCPGARIFWADCRCRPASATQRAGPVVVPRPQVQAE